MESAFLLENGKPVVLEADTVYLLMKKGFPISRNVRAQWVLKHLDDIISIQTPNSEIPELEIVSVIPKENSHTWCPANSYRYSYRVTSSTTIKFLAHKYRMVFSLDLSPSLATVDIQNGEIVIDEVSKATKRCLEGLTRPFVIPGSNREIFPEVYVTVIIHTPFFTNPAQVIVQGWLVTKDNVHNLMQVIESQLNLIEEKVAYVTNLVNLQLETLRTESERLVGGLFEESSATINKSNASSNLPTPAMVSPETGFVNILRYGMLALSLLPEHSCAHLVIVTDGIVGVSDVHALESVIQQLRATTIACSFLHVGSSYHPHSANGLVPYPDLLRFLATATLGTYMTDFPLTKYSEETNMNVYHKNLLCWQLFRTDNDEMRLLTPNAWRTKNNFFYGHEPPLLLRKKQIDHQVGCTLNSLLCCRLREGYLIKKAAIRDGCLEICFVLPWKSHVFIEYLVTCPRFMKSLSICNTLQYTITIEAPYDFLHDITCLSKKPLKSQYRQNMVSQFWGALTSLTESNSMLSHFSWFPGMSWSWYNVPDTIRSGMPVFNLPTSSSSSIQLSDAACPQFGQIWQPVVSLEPYQWPRWLHSQRVTLILIHDRPLSKHLHQANQSGRFQSVQFRQSAAVLWSMLKNWATFVLVENQTFVQFIHKEPDKPPISFSLINVTCKSLCVVLNVAFAGGTEGQLRHNVMADLLGRLSLLTLPSRRTEQREIPCCIIMHKALEKILIRYERMPIDLSTVIFPDGSQIMAKNALIAKGNLTTTLSRYLYHHRWLWLLKKPSVQILPSANLPKLNITAVARILSTITKIRLAEGFNFAYSAAGIMNTVMEVQMKGPENNDATHPCIVQYILFPPHVVVSPSGIEKDSGSEEETTEGTGDGENGIEDIEGTGDFQIVMEAWVEPQCGHVRNTAAKKAAYMHSLEYDQLPEAISNVDKECINAILTLEHLSLMCQSTTLDKGLTEKVNQQEIPGVTPNNVNNNNNNNNTSKSTRRPTYPTDVAVENTPIVDDRIRSMQFEFDVLGLLPKFQQAELLFSMFADDYSDQIELEHSANKIFMDGFLGHIKNLHNRELILSAAESDRFMKMLAARPREENAKLSYCGNESERYKNLMHFPRWKCFIKGISTTHVIVTMVPATESDVHMMTDPEEVDRQVLTTPVFANQTDSTSEHQEFKRIEIEGDVSPSPSSEISPEENPHAESNVNSELDFLKHFSSLAFSTPKKGEINESKAPSPSEGNSKRGLILPVYVYDCSLALLVDALIEKLDKPVFKDIYRDYTYGHSRNMGEHVREDFLNLKSGENTKPPSPEPKSEDSDNVSSDQRILMDHCKVLSLAHCHSYVFAVYKSLVLQQPIGYDEIDSAVEQCEESVIEINITDYLRAVCRHIGLSAEENSPCDEMRNIHNLIKDKFKKIINVAFRQAHVHPFFYYCLPSWKVDRLMDAPPQASSDSDDDVRFSFNTDVINGKICNSLKKVNHISSLMWSGGMLHERPKRSNSLSSTDSFLSDIQMDLDDRDQPPLFLQLNCSIRSKTTNFSSNPVKLLPTCFTEIAQDMEDYNLKDTTGLKVTLDIICLYLSKEILEVSIENTPVGLRTTSYCSEGSNRAGTENNDHSLERLQSFDPENSYDNLSNLPGRYHYNAVSNLEKEIHWLLKDETAAVLLDKPSPTESMLNFVAKHVADSNNRTSCYLDKVPLKFVFTLESSLPKFLEELKKLTVERYCIREQGNYFYFVKDPSTKHISTQNEKKKSPLLNGETQKSGNDEDISIFNFEDVPFTTSTQLKKQDSGDPPGYHSEISSIGDNQIGTEDGYEGDSSNSEDDCQWLIELDRRRDLLPNFWLILRVEDSNVNIYFHCRFLELNTPEVQRYQQVQKNTVTQIKSICRRVNQHLLLRDLHDKRMCDPLLETESMDDASWKGVEADAAILQNTGATGTGMQKKRNKFVSHFTPGIFKCPVVWEAPFTLHHRLKTGPGKTGLSRGALQSVLNRFSVNNRTNMFVYQETNGNVFYLRLQERTNDDRLLQSNKLSESDEKLMVSRSSSITSLSHAKIFGSLADQSSLTSTMDQLRPRVRSFGEKESDLMNKNEDSIILLVHGISDAGPEIRHELVQVLQNRLDEKVLEVLCVNLARNPMCKLTPSDVHFIQKPYRSPETVIRLSVQDWCLKYMDALGHYLRQNILKFLYTPNYMDSKTSSSHFQDYSQPDGSNKRVSESDIYLYNQSHSNQSGNLGLACIAIAIVNAKGEILSTINQKMSGFQFMKCPEMKDFEQIVSTNEYWGPNCEKSDFQHTPAKSYVEFRIWKQGRVNIESLVQKLKAAVRHANWDLITEYIFLPIPVAEPLEDESESHEKNSDPDFETDLVYKLGEKGKLNKIYHEILPYWFQFAIDLTVPAMKKHVVILEKRHALPVTLKELQNLIQSHALDTTARTFVKNTRQPFIDVDSEDEVLLSRSVENVEGNLKWLSKMSKNENKKEVTFIPYDFGKEPCTPVQSIIVARNFKQWLASCSDKIDQEEICVKDQKLLQKFNPLVLEKTFVPRQRLLLAEVQSNHIILYMYNWSKERSEKLTKQVTNLGHWLSSRASLHSSIIMQKLGIFYHQPMRNYDQDEQSNFQFSQITDMNSLAKFPSTAHVDNKDWQKNRSGAQSGAMFSWNQFMGQVMRDAKPSGQYPLNIVDPVVKAAHDFQELRHKEKKTKDDLNKLHTIWQSRGPVPNVPVSHSTLNTFKQHSRLIHYCHTPLLFLPTWRLQSAATRDHSLTPPPYYSAPGSQQRSRTTSNASTKKIISEWHREICESMLLEYKQYLQILGFNPITIESSQKTESDSALKHTCYLKKSMLGGVLLFEINLAEPFFIVKLRVIECSRLQAKSSSALVNQFMLSFLDACDKVKINMHLHSFTYDFHLRCIHSYIAGNCQWSLKHGYHLTNFLDDFNKYYSKAPNYARNLIYSGIVTVKNLITPAQTLYQYLLSHEKTYGMQVFSMSDDADNTEHSEYVLIKLQSTPLVSYHDAQDTKYTDDFDVAFIVSWLEQFTQSDSREIALKYYLMLTSKRELYPKRDTENSHKIGKFRTVYNMVRSSTTPHLDSPSESNPASFTSPSYLKQIKNEIESLQHKILPEDTIANLENPTDGITSSLAPTPPPVPDSPLAPQVLNSSTTSTSSANLSQIRQESINYLGYYSSHEQLMQQLIISQANAAQQHIRNMIEQGALHCRTHLLWNRLLESRSPMTYAEFTELRSLACVESISKIDPRLSPLVNQPIAWYQGLAKVLQNKYQEYHKQFNAPDGNVMYHLILHPNYVQAFMMLIIDLHTSRGELYAVYRKSEEILSTPFSIGDIYSLIEDFVNACCFHLWLGLYS